MPKVLVIFPNEWIFGSERGNIQVFIELKKAGYDILFVTDKSVGKKNVQPFLKSHNLDWCEIDFPGIFSSKMPINAWINKIYFFIKSGFQLLLIANKYRPTHIHICSALYFISILFGLLLVRAPIIYRVGDQTPYSSRLWIFFVRVVIKNRVSRYVCISNFVKNDLIKKIGQVNYLRVIYNNPPDRCDGISVDLSIPMFEGITLIFVGRMAENKGIDLLIDVAIKLCLRKQNLRFLIVGDLNFNKSFVNKLRAKVQTEKLYEKIIFTGQIEDIYKVFAVSDIHICPSIVEEALGNVVIEAKTVGVPSIVFPSGGLPEIIEHKVDGFICNDKSYNSLLEGIEFFINNFSKISVYKNNARKSLIKLGISREKFIKYWREVYEK